MRVQMLGLCRFSYAGLGGHQQVHQSLHDRRAMLYAPERLQRRWNWFEHVALPGLIAQTDPDYTLVIMTCPDLPDPYLSWLKELAEEVPAIKLELIAPEARYREACLAAITPHLDPAADVIGHFRHDDDDAVAVDYIASGKRDFRAVMPLWKRKGRLACDYAMGVVGRVGASGLKLESRLIYNATAGLTIYLSPDEQRTAIDFEHWKIPSIMPTITLAQRRMYFRLIHPDNDSGETGAGYALPQPDVPYSQLLSNRFAIELDTLHQLARDAAEQGAGQAAGVAVKAKE